MRLAKKVIAVALAVAMMTSMLTACSGGGGGGSSTGGNGSNISGGTTGGNGGTTGGDTGNGGGTGGGTGSGDTGNGGGNGETGGGAGAGTTETSTVKFVDSRTGKLFITLSTKGYTATLKVTDTDPEGTETNSLVISGDAKGHSYLAAPRSLIFDVVKSNPKKTMFVLADTQEDNEWLVLPMTPEEKAEAGLSGTNLAGICFKVENAYEFINGDDIIGDYFPEYMANFTTEKNAVNYIESQIDDDSNRISYWYEGSSQIPERVVLEDVYGEQFKEYNRAEISDAKLGEDKKLLDFDSILKDYYDVTDELKNVGNGSDVQSLMKAVKRAVVH